MDNSHQESYPLCALFDQFNEEDQVSHNHTTTAFVEKIFEYFKNHTRLVHIRHVQACDIIGVYFMIINPYVKDVHVAVFHTGQEPCFNSVYSVQAFEDTITRMVSIVTPKKPLTPPKVVPKPRTVLMEKPKLERTGPYTAFKWSRVLFEPFCPVRKSHY